MSIQHKSPAGTRRSNNVIIAQRCISMSFWCKMTLLLRYMSAGSLIASVVTTPSQRRHGPLSRYVKLQVAHGPGMPGTFSPPPRVSDPDMHHCTCVMHVPWCMLGSLTSGFLWSRWREKRSRHSRRMRNPLFSVSAKRPMYDKCPSQQVYALLTQHNCLKKKSEPLRYGDQKLSGKKWCQRHVQ